jgi:hypothetical protein
MTRDREGARDVGLALSHSQTDLRTGGTRADEQIRAEGEAQTRRTAPGEQLSLVEAALSLADVVQRDADDEGGDGSDGLGAPREEAAKWIGQSPLAVIFERQNRLTRDRFIVRGNQQTRQPGGRLILALSTEPDGRRAGGDGRQGALAARANLVLRQPEGGETGGAEPGAARRTSHSGAER